MHTLRARWSLQSRVFITVLCLFVASVQGFVAQTHFHAPAVPTAAVAAQSQNDSGSTHNRHASESCALCQVVLHGGGAPLLRPILSLPAPALQILAVSEQIVSSSIATVSYSWQSRGPPQF